MSDSLSTLLSAANATATTEQFDTIKRNFELNRDMVGNLACLLEDVQGDMIRVFEAREGTRFKSTMILLDAVEQLRKGSQDAYDILAAKFPEEPLP
jgi:inactivated superfamily I helicase